MQGWLPPFTTETMKQPLDIYDDMPREMKKYISNNGWHFNKKACDYAVKQMKRLNTATNKLEPIEPTHKEDIDAILTRNGVVLKNATLYDRVYVYNLGKKLFWQGAIEDEKHLALFVRNYLDGADEPEDYAFRSFVTKCVAKGEPIDWDEIV